MGLSGDVVGCGVWDVVCVLSCCSAGAKKEGIFGCGVCHATQQYAGHTHHATVNTTVPHPPHHPQQKESDQWSKLPIPRVHEPLEQQLAVGEAHDIPPLQLPLGVPGMPSGSLEEVVCDIVLHCVDHVLHFGGNHGWDVFDY